MFSSRPLAERNDDPTPYWCVNGVRWSDGKHEGVCHCKPIASHPHITYYGPRPEFQYGKLPANPVLTAFRESIDHLPILPVEADRWAYKIEQFDLFGGMQHDHSTALAVIMEATIEQNAHAHRVLTLLATLSPSLSTR